MAALEQALAPPISGRYLGGLSGSDVALAELCADLAQHVAVTRDGAAAVERRPPYREE
jgi:hypothetical protein